MARATGREGWVGTSDHLGKRGPRRGEGHSRFVGFEKKLTGVETGRLVASPFMALVEVPRARRGS